MSYTELFIDKKLPAPLNDEEIYNYFKQMNSGDISARKEIIIHNIRLVTCIVLNRFSLTSYDKKDLVSIGIIGLIKSVDSFDINKGYQFSTYASHCINNEILMFMRKNNKGANNISFDSPICIDESGNDLKLESILIDEETDFVSDYETKVLYQIIHQVINDLPLREKSIVMEYFGFIDDIPKSQRQLAFEFGLSQSYISRIIKKTLIIISSKLKKNTIIEDPIKKSLVSKKKN